MSGCSKKIGISTAIETSAYCQWEAIENSLPYTDYYLVDIKSMDVKRHEEYTGVSNELILENIIKLSRATNSLVLRMPLIPGFNDDKKCNGDSKDR